MKKQVQPRSWTYRVVAAIGLLLFSSSAFAEFKDTTSMEHRFLMDQIGENNTIADVAPGGGGGMLLL